MLGFTKNSVHDSRSVQGFFVFDCFFGYEFLLSQKGFLMSKGKSGRYDIYE